MSKKSLALQDSVPPGRVQPVPPPDTVRGRSQGICLPSEHPRCYRAARLFRDLSCLSSGGVISSGRSSRALAALGNKHNQSCPHGTDPSAAPRGSARPHSHPLSPHEASGPKKEQTCPQSCSCSGGSSQGHPAPGTVPVPTHTAPHRLAPKRTSERGCGWKAKNKNKKIRSWG